MSPYPEQVLVRVKTAGINPSEAVIRTGAVADLFPSTFPSGQGSDLAGVIEEVGAGASGFSPGDEVAVPATLTLTDAHAVPFDDELEGFGRLRSP